MPLTAGSASRWRCWRWRSRSSATAWPSFTGSQAGVTTDEVHGKARITDVTPGRIRSAIDEGHIAIAAGFQGVSQTTKNITTLGRGGSDTTAVALAAALGADVCEIYTDVDGVFTADPRIVPTARRLERLSPTRCSRWQPTGPRSYAALRRIRPSLQHPHPRALVVLAQGRHAHHRQASRRRGRGGTHHRRRRPRPWRGEGHRRRRARPPRQGRADLPRRRRVRGQHRHDRAERVGRRHRTCTDISFTLPKTDGQRTVQALDRVRDEIGFESLQYDDHIGKLSLIGAGMRSNPGVSATFFRALSDANVNIEMISTSEIRISVVTRDDTLDDAVRAVHSAFGPTPVRGKRSSTEAPVGDRTQQAHVGGRSHRRRGLCHCIPSRVMTSGGRSGSWGRRGRRAGCVRCAARTSRCVTLCPRSSTGSTSRCSMCPTTWRRTGHLAAAMPSSTGRRSSASSPTCRGALN